MVELSQDNRIVTVSDFYPGAEVVATRVDAVATISEPFRFSVGVVSSETAMDPLKVIGKTAGVTIRLSNDELLPLHGVVASMAKADTFELDETPLRGYQLELVPAFSLLKHHTNCRVFQTKSYPEVVEQILKDGKVDYSLKLKDTYEKVEYCVQYQESDFDFVSRLMEEVGIFYYFTHDKAAHRMILGDKSTSYVAAPAIRFSSDSQFAFETVTSWNHNYALHGTKSEIGVFDFEQPGSMVLSKEKMKLKTKTPDPSTYFEYQTAPLAMKGKALAVTRIEHEEARHHTISGEGAHAVLQPGIKFKLTDHPSDDENQLEVVVKSAQHHIEEPLLPGSADVQFDVQSVFDAVPADVPLRPLRIRSRPLAVGPQPAKVVGGKGAEILTDKYGRVKIQFPWDREGRYDDKSSCFVRVAQGWAGNNRGMQFVPRVGDEVLVEFLEGDPSRPIITGSVYNGDNKSPWPLPDEAHVSGIKTLSTDKAKAKNFNELSFHDQIGKEKIYFHAERDFERVVENDDRLKIGFDTKDKGDRVVDIYNDRTVTLEAGKDTLHVKAGDRIVNIDKGNHVVTVKSGDMKVSVKSGQHVLEAAKSILFKVGGSTIKIEPAAVTIKTADLKLQADMKAALKGTMVDVNGSAMTTIKGGLVKIN